MVPNRPLSYSATQLPFRLMPVKACGFAPHSFEWLAIIVRSSNYYLLKSYLTSIISMAYKMIFVNMSLLTFCSL